MTEPSDRPAAVAGLFQSLSTFLGSLVGIIHTRLELLTTELQEEVREVGEILVWAFIAAFAALMALFLTALAVIFVFWDTHRIAASIGTIVAFLLIAGGAALILRRKLKSKSPLLDDTLAELAKDRDQLRARVSGRQ